MEFTDYLWWKMGAMVLLAVIYNFIRGWQEGRAERDRKEAERNSPRGQ